LQLLRLLRQRAELHELFDKYATDDDVLTPKQFLKFLQREQKVRPTPYPQPCFPGSCL
jgi:hypothetical protein